MRGFSACIFLAALSVLLSANGCTTLEDRFAEASGELVEDRDEALTDLEEIIRERVTSSLAITPTAERAADTQKLSDFFLARFAKEEEPVLREKLLALAIQGQLPCADRLCLQAAQDPKWHVRLYAVKGLVERNPEGTREILLNLLRNDPELLVRSEAAKACRFVGDESCVPALVEVLASEGEDRNLRYQAYRSAAALSGRDLPFVPELWLPPKGTEPSPKGTKSD